MSTKPISLNTDKLSNYQQWKKANGGDFSLWDYLSGVANAEIALAFTKLFLPDFVEHEGGIFLSEAFNRQIYEQWKAKLGNDIASIERVMNHQHIDDLLAGADTVGADNLFYLGQVLAQMWESHLKSLYPSRRFKMICNPDYPTVLVTFYQIRD
ncbi:MAG: hypothetical protein KME26_24075 [Oscillatoria princeps RMCB-10]|jgi:hypothetical protein|nr:hypothetical protein [Oscillatoria princeps RMCB-10]